MNLADVGHGPALGHPAVSPVRRRSLWDAASTAPPSPRGGGARPFNPCRALAASHNEPGDDGSPTRALEGGAVPHVRERS